ncbi:MAG: 30S ribosomal protein S12 [Candidatus Aenigmarchaeota archaeon]|nr:30S ribosomal protein S12 [Candidatus Aenigmarchaeota archaeon]
MAGEYGARKLKAKRRKYRWKKANYRNRILQLKKRKDPFGGAPQAKGIVLEKKMVEQKQPHSGLIKAVRVRLLKNGKEVTAHVPRTGAIKCIGEHDQVLLEGMGGSQHGAVGSMWGIKWRVIAVNNIPLELIRTGKKQKPVK